VSATWRIWLVALGSLGGCYLSHERDAVSGDAGFDGLATDTSVVGSCEALPGADVCGCVAEYRRCDTCDVACPAGSRCWDTVGVCRPFDVDRGGSRPYEASCTLSFDRDLAVHTYCFDGRACSVRQGSGGAFDPMSGPCMSADFCREAAYAMPALPREPVCVDSFGIPFDGSTSASMCPGPSFCGGVCEPCPAVGSGFASCVGRGEGRPFGVCTSGFDPRCTGAWGSVGGGQACLLIDTETLGWVVSEEACDVYRMLVPTARCVDARGRDRD